jgi:hypothetical protein
MNKPTFLKLYLWPALILGVLVISVAGYTAWEINKTNPTYENRDFSTYATLAPPEVQKAAERDLQKFLNAIPAKELRIFNFSNPAEFRQAKVGRPFRVFTIQTNDILAYTPRTPLLDLIKPQPTWFFPVIAQDRYRTILTVELVDNEWRAIEIGNSDLAIAFADVRAKFPVTSGYEHIFIRNYQTLSEFVILIRSGSVSVFPLPTAVSSWGLKEARVLEVSEALSLLKTSLQKRRIQ